MAGAFSTCFNSLVFYVFSRTKSLVVILLSGDILNAFCQVITVVKEIYIASNVKKIHTTLFFIIFQAEIVMILILLALSITIIFGITCERYIAEHNCEKHNLQRNGIHFCSFCNQCIVWKISNNC